MASSLNPMAVEKRKPAPLKSGDLIAVVAPAGPVHEAALAGGIKVLENKGFRVTVGEHVRDQLGYLAGPDEARVADLNAALRNPDVRGIIAARGGYGCGRLLGLVDYEAARNDPKVFVGYSDLTALHCAFARQAGLVTFHGPMVESLGQNLTRLTLDLFLRAITTTEPLDVLPMPADYPPPQVLGAGRATGILAGGNLSLVAGLMGTPYELDARGRVLMLEEVHEEPYRIDRMLRQLALGGKFGQAAGVALGEMIGCEYRAAEATAVTGQPAGRPNGGAPQPLAADVEVAVPPAGLSAEAPRVVPALFLGDVLTDYFSRLGKPVIAGLPSGHGRDKWTLPFGCATTVDGYKGRLIIEEAACEKRV